MVTKIRLGQFSRQIARDDVSLFLETLGTGGTEGGVDGAAINLFVIHFPLAPFGFFLIDKLQEAESVGALAGLILIRLNSSLEHLVSVFFKELEEFQIVEVLGEITDEDRCHGMLLAEISGGTLVPYLILSRWIVAVNPLALLGH